MIKNIWILNHHACGPGRHSIISEKLAERGYNVTLFASSFEHYTYKETKDYNNKNFIVENDKNYKRVYIKTPPYYKNDVKRLINQIIFAIRAIKTSSKLEKPDIVIGSSVHLFTGLAAYRISKKYDIPFIFEVRDLWPQTLIDLGALKEKSIPTLVFKKIEKFLYNKANKIISLLPKGVDYISSLGINEDKVEYIPNGVDLNWYDECSDKYFLNDEFDKFFKTNKEEIIYTYTGAFGLANGLSTLVESAKILQDKNIDNIHFLLVGDGPLKSELIKKANEYKLENLTFMDKVDKNVIPLILSKSDCNIAIVKRSKVHRYGVSMNKIFDYLASEKPMIYAIDSNYDFAKIAHCGNSILPDNPTELAITIENMSNKTMAERKELGINGRKFVENNHEYDILVDRLVKLLNSTVNKKN